MEGRPAPRWVLPADDDLIRAIGRAVYGFAQFELSVERAREALGGPPDGCRDGAAQVLRVLALYRGLKERRDALLRARPAQGGAGDGGAPASAWRTEDVLRMARDVEAAAIEVNRLLRRHF